jgi:hypothetical protein
MPEEFFTAYIACALWLSTDESTDSGGFPLDDNYTAADIDADTLAAMRVDCEAFYQETTDAIDGENSQAGHDFWLTRNGHGAGFWDGDWKEPAASILDEASKAFGNVDLYLGDDGWIYAS